LKKTLVVLICLSFWLAGCAARPTDKEITVLPVDEDLQLEMVLSDSRWEASDQPPAYLVEYITGHMREEMAGSGKQFSEDQLVQVAKKRLAKNEAFVLNSASGAYLMVDFRRLPEDAPPLDKEDIYASAHGAGIVLENEEGVSEVSADVRSTRVHGSRLAYRTDIQYRMHGEPRRFIGIIGCTASHRFYLYYTDFLMDPVDIELMEEMLRSSRIRTIDHS
jgi:hypothetical protein